MNRRIEVARDFSKYPGGRYVADGSFSGEEFREKLLWPALQEVPEKYSSIVVVLDGTAGYPASFLEEAFGGIVRVHGLKGSELTRALKIEAKDPHFEVYQRLIAQYIKEASARLEAGAT